MSRSVEMNLAYRWFCQLGLEDRVPDHSMFSVNRHGRFRDSDIPRKVFEEVVCGCMGAGLTGARDEFLLTATVQNLKRLVACVGIPPPRHATA